MSALYQLYIEITRIADKIVVVWYGQELDGEKLRTLRRTRNLSQLELAVQAGTTQATISELERNRRRVQYRTARRLAAALGVGPEELLKHRA